MNVGRLLELSGTSSKSVSSAEKTTTTCSENDEFEFDHLTYKYYDFIPFIPFFDFQYEKNIFNCQPSHFSPCSAVPAFKFLEQVKVKTRGLKRFRNDEV